MNLFQQGIFTLNSGQVSTLKIECDALTPEDWDTLATVVIDRIKPFGNLQRAIGVPTGGEPFAAALNKRASNHEDDPILIVDDVLTTGGSMERFRLLHPGALGIVVFARAKPPDWIKAIFQMW